MCIHRDDGICTIRKDSNLSSSILLFDFDFFTVDFIGIYNVPLCREHIHALLVQLLFQAFLCRREDTINMPEEGLENRRDWKLKDAPRY